MRNLRTVFWVETILAASAFLLGAVTCAQPAWIERILPLDPDHTSGALEWKLVVTLFLAAGLFSTLAVRSWRKTQPAR